MNPENLDDILKRLLASVPEVKAVLILSVEGLPIASALPEGVDETRISAIIAVLHSIAKRSVIEMKKGEFDQLFIKGKDGYLLVLQAGPKAIIVVSTMTAVRLGLVFLDSKKAGERISEYLDFYDKSQFPMSVVEKAWEIIDSIMKKESISEVTLERQYLPEIIDNEALELSKDDGLPTLKRFVANYFKKKGINVEIYGNVVKFLKSERLNRE